MTRERGRGAVSAPIRDRLDEIAGSARFAYGSIFLIQAKVLWGIWLHRDLPAGDSSDHFIRAAQWSDHAQLDALFSPLYTLFWGSLDWLIGDTYAAAIAHRILIVVAVSLLVVAVLRRLLSPGIAWALAAWWALLPVVYDTITEVHLFVMLPLLAAVLVAASWSGRPMRAVVFGILLGTGVLVRNELVIGAAIWLLASVVYEARARGKAGRRLDWTASLRAAAPYAAAGLAVVALGVVSMLRYPTQIGVGDWVDYASEKQDFAFCQHYAVGYEQRTQGLVSNGWNGCEAFMERDFGRPRPSLTEALAADPRALAAHFGWNAQLAPYGMQEALFARTSGSEEKNPDYFPVVTGSGVALLASLALLALTGTGLALLWSDRRRWWREWVRERAWGWLALGCMTATGAWVAITTHPRPAYLFPLTFAVICVIGMCAMALLRRWPGLTRLRWTVPIGAVLIVALVPSHYPSGYETEFTGSGRPLATMVSRLEPFGKRFRGRENVLHATLAREACNYLGRGDECTPSTLHLNARPPGTSSAGWLDQHGVDYFYADERTLAGPRGEALLEELQAYGWVPLAPAPLDRSWVLLARPGAGG